MPIRKFRMTTGITLSDLEKDLDKFIIPESYCYLDNFKDLESYIKKNIKFTGEIVENSFEKVTEKDICRKNY